MRLRSLPFIIIFIFAFVIGAAVPVKLFAELKSQPAPEGAEVYFIEPMDGATVSEEFAVKFGLRGLGVAPAGTVNKMTGHHHILINMDKLPALDRPLPASEQIMHFGGGQTETTLKLPKGTHTLQLIVGDHLHIPHTPPVMSKKITIVVE